eukprot:642310-Pyramimonas_sp.AAC.1
MKAGIDAACEPASKIAPGASAKVCRAASTPWASKRSAASSATLGSHWTAACGGSHTQLAWAPAAPNGGMRRAPPPGTTTARKCPGNRRTSTQMNVTPVASV